LDSGILIKIFDIHNYRGGIPNHEQINRLYNNLLRSYNFITTNIIISEALANITNLIFKKNNPYTIEDLKEFNSNYVQKHISIIYIEDDFYHNRALEIIQNFRPYKYNYIDAISLAFIEKMGGYVTFTLDEKWKYFTFLKGYSLAVLEIVDIL